MKLVAAPEKSTAVASATEREGREDSKSAACCVFAGSTSIERLGPDRRAGTADCGAKALADPRSKAAAVAAVRSDTIIFDGRGFN